MKAGKSVAFATLADIVITTLREHLRFLARASFHSTRPGSLSLLQVSTHSEEVRVAAHRQLLES
ncbi:hypothetical protein [Bradyrhizobium sp. 179]|uniref:hypothetical protein n=1 Tax=Bradyrhizobium sp. 179 TaxID=2782648 RepID=UPI003208066D